MLKNEFKIVAAFALLVLAMAVLDYYKPIDELVLNDAPVIKSLRQWTHSLGTLCLGILAVIFVDRIFLPWLNLHQVIFGLDNWKK